jgi:acetoacetate decarboxylase
MTEEDVRRQAFAMPLTNPALPAGPYRFADREYLIITYRTDPAALARILPAPLVAAQPLVKYEFINMPDSTGFGHYCESGQVIPCSAWPPARWASSTNGSTPPPWRQAWARPATC